MRHCKVCNSKMLVRLSKTEPFFYKYFWGCSAFPVCRNIENTILTKKDFGAYYLGNNTANSMSKLRPTDIVIDAERHYAIYNHFNYDHNFLKSDIDNLDVLLGFDELQDFYFWIATQQSIVTHSVHNYLPVGSPYYYTFRNLTDTINHFFSNVIAIIVFEKQSLIESSISVWTDFFQRRAEAKSNSQKVSTEKIEADHKEAVKRKADKASHDIFNAILRKDIKAILALRQRGANLNHKNKDGLTCYEFALTLKDERLIEALTINLIE